jgi:glycosyltransferase involved in cell wall biosynthesis
VTTEGAAGVPTAPSEGRRVVLVEFPPSGGLFQFSLQLGEGLARRGHAVEIWTGPRPEARSREAGCRVRSLLPTWHPAAGSGSPAVWRRLRRLVRALRHTLAWGVVLGGLRVRRPDVVLWSAWRFPVDGWGVTVARRLLPRAVLGLVAHEPRPLTEQGGRTDLYAGGALTRRAFTRAYACLDVAYVLGESARSVLQETWPVAAPVHVVPHGDETIFRREPPPPASETAPEALFFGTITRYKGLDDLLAAWPAVRREVPAARLRVVGAVSGDVDADALRARVAALPGVELSTGYVPLEQVAPLVAAARLVVLPYRRSSQSGVAHLAHTFARPVVATRVGDVPAAVVDGVSGLLVEPGDRDGLVSAVVALLRDPARARRLGEAGCAALGATASWDDVARAVDAGLPAGPRR